MKKKKSRMVYERPRLLPLTEASAAVGANCNAGSNASSTCWDGTSPGGSCEAGSGVSGQCGTGIEANFCRFGFQGG